MYPMYEYINELDNAESIITLGYIINPLYSWIPNLQIYLLGKIFL